VLIQDVLSFREYIQPFLGPLYEPWAYQGLVLEKAIEFTIRELIWQNTQCIVSNHHQNKWGYRQLFDQLKTVMIQPPLEAAFQHLIKVPIIYGDAQMAVDLNGRDLTISYYIPRPLRLI
jgi:hypothetical protein